ncbi:UTP--glucose-1-phosphate uridylyltransferase [Jatrophihabitans endophyticus]|uniref:UTP--glucose-1-phosphate uridylyltransferase n=1 Tax=Jatrophihabitans endophyticus TaxID=1206085 RepID=A0A1M5U1C7_9ACTN|nr:UTP--glucose-1-phosphate uridylyltransferase [Jatrophihabitans endophyticus]SHH56670.1 UTP--glucose-1-phosphate uridylyltransferase [Jatrophihabitans endophyticus]
MSADNLAAAVQRMRDADVSAEAIATFERGYRLIEQGESGIIVEESIEPLGELPELAGLDAPIDDDAVHATVMIRLNGGLGTSMGLDTAKTLLPVKPGTTFLDVIARQTLAFRRRHAVALPLVFMNSFRTQQPTLEALARYEDLAVDGLPIDFLQSREPKLREDDLAPVDWPADPDLEWCPPGHADVYPSLRASGLLEQLLAAGYRYAFCANADNLGAVVDPRLPSWLAATGTPMALECCVRTPAERKGGHLAVRRSDGRLILRETAQTSDEDAAAMQDLTRHRYFNTNNLWLDLQALADELDRSDGALELPIIRNSKTVDPSDATSTPVVQIEAAMGSAVSRFDGARAVAVGRDRFIPVKTTDDLLLLRSDVFELDDEYLLRTATDPLPLVSLDKDHYKLVPDFDRHFPAGPPSLTSATALTVEGDVTFGADVRVVGDVTVSAADLDDGRVPDGAVLGE